MPREARSLSWDDSYYHRRGGGGGAGEYGSGTNHYGYNYDYGDDGDGGDPGAIPSSKSSSRLNSRRQHTSSSHSSKGVLPLQLSPTTTVQLPGSSFVSSPQQSPTPVVLRTNFGKNSVYRPPTTVPATSWGGSTSGVVVGIHPVGHAGSPPESPMRWQSPHPYTADYSSSSANNSVVTHDSDLPFDQQTQRRTVTVPMVAGSKNRQASLSLSQPHPLVPTISSHTVETLPFDEGGGRAAATRRGKSTTTATTTTTTTTTAAATTATTTTERRGDRLDRRRRGSFEEVTAVGAVSPGADEGVTRYSVESSSLGWRDTLSETEESGSGPHHRQQYRGMRDDRDHPHRSDRSYYSDPDESPQRRYRMAPPRISDPILLPYLANSSTNTAYTTNAVPTSRGAVERGRGGAAALAKGGTRERSRRPTFASSGRNGRDQPEEDDDDNDDNDSLFDFEDGEAAKAAAVGRRRVVAASKGRRGRNATAYVSDDDDDEEEEDDDDDEGDANDLAAPPTTLTERAQQAWKRKKSQHRASASAAMAAAAANKSRKDKDDDDDDPQPFSKALAPRAAASSSRDKSPAPAGVHFSQTRDTVHHFEPDETADSVTFGGRSLNSEYTKSAESEVEDFIKDILMIGSGKGNNPGRRKIKYNPQVKQKLKKKGKDKHGKSRKGDRARSTVPSTPTTDADGDDDFDEEVTFDDEVDDPCLSPKNSSSRTAADAKSSPNAPRVFCSADSLDEGKTDGDPLSSVWNYIEGGLNAVTTVLGFDDGSNSSSLQQRPSSLRRSSDPASPSDRDSTTTATTSPRGFFDRMLADTEASMEEEKRDGRIRPAPSLEEDARLVDLAVQAARSMHKLRGFEYDESNEIDIASDIRFSVVDLRLPLGLIFQENETGCWVTKVLPDGSAARSNFIDVGDQLAAIDGVSAIKMTVDQIAGLIRRKSNDIELTFLRYVGPWRPAEGTVAEEGYEVRMQTRREGYNRVERCGAALVAGVPLKPLSSSSSGKLMSSNRLVIAPSERQLKGSSESKKSLSQAQYKKRQQQQQQQLQPQTSTTQQSSAQEKKRFWRFGKKK